LLHLLHSFARQVQNVVWRGTRLLDETMDDTDAVAVGEKQHACYAVAREIGPQFPKTATERSAKWHADGPSALDAPEIGPDCPTIGFG